MKLSDYQFSTERGLSVGRIRFRDDAFKFRMGAGYAGTINRTHPVDVNPEIPDSTYYPTAYGMPVIIDASSHNVRMYKATGDTAVVTIYGVTVRPYPTQQPQASTDFAPATFASGAPPTSGVIDILKRGYILVQLGNGSITGAVKGGPVYVCAQASNGNDLLGYFTTTASGNAALTDCTFNGVEDANGIVEVAVHI